MSLWDSEEAASAYVAFDACFDRYRRANEALAAHAAVEGAVTVLDVGAGAGGTARALLPRLDAAGRIVCVEPASAMRAAASLGDRRVSWTDRMPADTFDRVVCGASLWLLGPVGEALGALAARLRSGGALVFAIPAGYLGEPDPPGPSWATELPRRFTEGRALAPPAGAAFPDAAGVEASLRDLGLRPRPFTFETHWTRRSYAAWLALPPVAGAMRPDLSQPEREHLLRTLTAEPASGTRLERWRGWAAWA